VRGRLWKHFMSGLVVSASLGGPWAVALPVMPPDAIRPILPVTPVVDRPEIRSYQPYSGLQFRFRPEPPLQRGVRQKRPKIVAPKPVEPVIEFGSPRPYSVERYTYCPDRPGQIEPRDGPYGHAPLGQRTCP
jgi:hypothetical protein